MNPNPAAAAAHAAPKAEAAAAAATAAGGTGMGMGMGGIPRTKTGRKVLTVAALKHLLGGLGLDTSGKKSALVERLERHVEAAAALRNGGSVVGAPLVVPAAAAAPTQVLTLALTLTLTLILTLTLALALALTLTLTHAGAGGGGSPDGGGGGGVGEGKCGGSCVDDRSGVACREHRRASWVAHILLSVRVHPLASCFGSSTHVPDTYGAALLLPGLRVPL